MSTRLHGYRRHAERYGTDGVYEAAAAALDGFEPRELGQLALALRTLNPEWNLTREQRADLLARLEPLKLPDKELRKLLGIGQDTLRRMREPALESGESAAKPWIWQKGPDGLNLLLRGRAFNTDPGLDIAGAATLGLWQ